MERTRTIGLCLIATFAISAVAAATAAAEAPEYGRCVAQTGGRFKDPGCTKEAASKGKYEWTAGVEKSNFTTKSAGKIVLESVGKHQIVCKSESGSGDYTGPKTFNMKITLNGCEAEGIPAESKLEGIKEGEIILGQEGLEGHLGIIEAGATAAKDKIGTQVGRTYEVEECIIWDDGHGHFGEDCVPVLEIDDDPPAAKPMVTTPLKFVQSRGHQKPERFEGGPLTVIFSKWDGGELQQAGLSLTMVQTNEEPVEINPAV
jgi:hypothetical protein